MKRAKALSGIWAVALACISGCATEPPRPPPTPPVSPPIPSKPLDARQPTPWQTESRDYSRPQFSISVTYIPDGARLEIHGRVEQSDCRVVIKEARDIPTQSYSSKQAVWLQEWKTERRMLPPQIEQWKATSVRIENPYGSALVACVSEDGSFITTLNTDGSVFFSKPQLTKYLRATTVKGRNVSVVPSGLPSSLSASADMALPDVYQIEANHQLIEDFVRSHISDVVVVCYDQNSRTPVMPRVQVSSTDGITEHRLREILAAEFSGSEELVRIGLSAARGLLFMGDKQTSITQDMSFRAWTGTSFKISATHPDYYFFEANLVADKPGKTRKNILLIEKGKKVRVDNVKEGQGGAIVDQQ